MLDAYTFQYLSGPAYVWIVLNFVDVLLLNVVEYNVRISTVATVRGRTLERQSTVDKVLL